MGDFDLNLQTAKEHLDEDNAEGSVVLGVLDGSIPSEEWVQFVARGSVLFLAIEGDLNEPASGFARNVKDMGGRPTYFREFPVVFPPGVDINMDDL